MSKKKQQPANDQGRAKHPDQQQSGQARHDPKFDAQQPGTGKVANDHNRQGEQPPTQKNEGRRTPHSRSDREARIGGGNQAKSQRGGPGSGQK